MYFLRVSNLIAGRQILFLTYNLSGTMMCGTIPIIFIVLPLLASSLAPPGVSISKDAYQPKVPILCKNTHCPAIEKPVCAKFKYKDAELNNREIYIYMINKCEMQYIKCHQDAEAVVVPMKHCVHKKPGNPDKKRAKRSIAKDKLSKTSLKGRMKSATVAPIAKKPKQHEAFDSEGSQPKHSSLRRKKHKLKKRHGRKHKRRGRKHNRRNENKGKMEEKTKSSLNKSGKAKSVNNKTVKKNKSAASKKTIKRTKETDSKKAKVSMKKNATDLRRDDKPFFDEQFFSNAVVMDAGGEENDSPTLLVKPIDDPASRDPMKKGYSDSSDLTLSTSDSSSLSTSSSSSSYDDYSDSYEFLSKVHGRGGNSGQADKSRYDEECPSVCPSRSVMVCARCQHGVYRTFMSVCHMRMFACHQQDEKLELMSRSPCVLSAPFLSSTKDMNMEPEGHVTEPGDFDGVLRFIYCREKDEFGSKIIVDPRCNQYNGDNRSKAVLPANYEYVDF